VSKKTGKILCAFAHAVHVPKDCIPVVFVHFQSTEGGYINGGVGKISIKVDVDRFTLVNTMVCFSLSDDVSMDVSHARSVIKMLVGEIVAHLCGDGLDTDELLSAVKDSLSDFLTDEKVEVKKAFLGTM